MKPFDQQLEDDLRWREAELASLFRLAALSTEQSTARASLLRALIAMLYAHFEGFTKFCWGALLDQIQSETVEIDNLASHFQALALYKSINELKSDLKHESILEFVLRTLPQQMRFTATFHEDCRPSPESNLWPNVFENEAGRLGIVCDQLDMHRAMIRSLVSRRNDIAHGESMTIRSLSEYKRHEHAVMIVLHNLALESLSIVDDRKYLRTHKSTLPDSQQPTLFETGEAE